MTRRTTFLFAVVSSLCLYGVMYINSGFQPLKVTSKSHKTTNCNYFAIVRHKKPLFEEHYLAIGMFDALIAYSSLGPPFADETNGFIVKIVEPPHKKALVSDVSKIQYRYCVNFM